MSKVAVIIVGKTDQELWSLTPETRLARLTARAGAGQIKTLSQLGPEEPALIL